MQRSADLTKCLFPADGVYWLVSMPEGKPSQTLWPDLMDEDGLSTPSACECCCGCGRGADAGADAE